MTVAGRLLPLTVFLALTVLLMLGLGRDPALLPSPLVGKTVPAFALQDLHAGKVVHSAAFAGQPWALNVWASWCITCQAEMPYLLRLREAGVTFVGLDYKDEDAQALRWLARFGNPYSRNLVDAEGALGLDLGVYGVPETFIIDASGTIVYKHVGAIDDAHDQAAFLVAWHSAVNN